MSTVELPAEAVPHVNETDMKIIRALAEHAEGRMKVSELKESIGVSLSHTSERISRMEWYNVLATAEDGDDGRSKIVTLSDNVIFYE